MSTDVAAKPTLICSWCQGPVDPTAGFKREVVIRRHNWSDKRVIYFCAHYEFPMWAKSLGRRLIRWKAL